MLRNFIYIKDNFLLNKECDQIINFFVNKPKEYFEGGGYEGVFIEDDSEYLKDNTFSFLN